MAHAARTVRTSWGSEDAFSYMADLSHIEEWDPGVERARRVDAGQIALGSQFELTVRMSGRSRRTMMLRYEVTDLGPGTITFTARSNFLESVDTVTVTPRDGGADVCYDARISFRGVLRLADPLLALAFRGIAERAIHGLELRLSDVDRP